MNNDASPARSSSRLRVPPLPFAHPQPPNTNDTDAQDDATTQLRPGSRSGRRRKKKNKKRRNPGLVKRLAHITHLLKSLDLVVFAELSSLYYMECSLFRFGLRAACQYMYLTPKDDTFPFLMRPSRIHVVLIMIPNIICMLLHLLISPPEGPAHHRGYQHGGLIIDFIGQKPPGYRIYYILADLVILALQCLMLSIHSERENLRLALRTFKPFLPELVPETPPGRTIEDLDAEERGLSWQNPSVMVNEAGEIEMQPLDRQQSRRESQEQGETSAAGAAGQGNTGDDVTHTYLSDLMSSGNGVVGEFHVLHTLKAAAMEVERTTAASIQTIGYGATLAAIQARRRTTDNTLRPSTSG